MKSYFSLGVTILAVLLLSGGGLLVTHAATPPTANDYSHNNPSSQILTMNIEGSVASAGNQRYFIHQNGPALEAAIGGDPLVTSQLSYTLYANQQGLSTSGFAIFRLTGMGASGTSYSVSGKIQLSSSIVGACLPSFTMGSCASTDTSEVPAAFTGAGSVQFATPTNSGNNNRQGNDNGFGNGNGHGYGDSYSGSGNSPTGMTEVMAFQSAYFNPFGDAITITSADSSIIIVTNYTQATIDWTNVIDAGLFTGSVGTTPISGVFTQVATEHENLVAGTARDTGIITLSNVMNTASSSEISYLEATGGYVGTSIIPTTGATSCGPTCTSTGFQDQGSFTLSSGQGHDRVSIRGSYVTGWSVPAFGFVSSVNGAVSQMSS